MEIDFEQVSSIVKLAALEELMPRFTAVSGKRKADGSIVTEADYSMQNRMEKELLDLFPNTSLLSEEMTIEEQSSALKSGNPVWCLDPLDGTSNFAAGIPYFAVSLSLIQNKKVIMGLVYDPVRDECFFSQDNKPALLNNNKIEFLNNTEDIYSAVAIVDLKRLDSFLSAQIVKEHPFASQRNFGASALDWCWLAINRGHTYLHGKQNIWDYSAGNFIFHNAGGSSCTLDGETIFNCSLEGRSVVAAVNERLLKNWFNWINKNQSH